MRLHRLALYLFLVTVSDAQGLSYYSDASLGRRLKLDPLQLAAARAALEKADLIAYHKPLYQVLSLEATAVPPTTPTAQRTGQSLSVADILAPSSRRQPMIDYDTFCQIRWLAEHQQLKPSQIAAELHLDPKTVEKWMARQSFAPRKNSKRPSKLDAFKGQIVALLERHPYTAQQIFQQLQPQGYAGGYSILKEFVRQVRPVRKPAFLMLEFAAGRMRPGGLGQLRLGHRRLHPPAPELLRHGAVLQPHAVCGVHPLRRPWSSSCPAIATPSSSSAASRQKS